MKITNYFRPKVVDKVNKSEGPIVTPSPLSVSAVPFSKTIVTPHLGKHNTPKNNENRQNNNTFNESDTTTVCSPNAYYFESSIGIGKVDKQQQQQQQQQYYLREINKDNVDQVRFLNGVIFPVKYNDKFYQNLIGVGDLGRICYHKNIAIGSVCARYNVTDDPTAGVYLMTLGCLSTFRGNGVGTIMLRHIINVCKERACDIPFIMLHVQINNKPALKFYLSHGFVIEQRVEQYYRRISPTAAYLLKKYLIN